MPPMSLWWYQGGAKPEWRHNQDYWAERELIPAIDLDDAAFDYA